MTQEERDEITKELQRKMAQNLQRNFTTPEQSKQLLEIGVPADSADCYYTSQTAISHGENGTIFYHPKWFEYNDTYSKLKSQFPLTDYLIPCWTTGRLEEIFDICDKDKFVLDEWPSHVANMYLHSLTQVEYFVTWATNCKQLLDFSKLGM